MEEKEKNKTKRLLLNVSSELHMEVKKRAVVRGIPLSTWLKRAIMEQIKKEQQYE